MSRPKSLRKVMPILVRMFARFKPYLHDHRWLAGGSLSALLFDVVLRLIEPWPLKYVFDYVIADQVSSKTAGSVDSGLSPGTMLAWCAVALVLVTVTRAVVSYGSTVGLALVGNRVLTRVRGDLYRHLQSLSLSYHTGAKNGDLVVRVIGDVGLIKEVVVTAALPLLGSILVLIGMIVVMLVMNWQLALIAMSIVPLFWLSTTRLSRRIGDAARVQRKREGAMAATAAESISAIKTVQALSLESVFEGVFDSQNKKSLAEGVKTKRLSVKLERTVDVLIAISTALVLWAGTRMILDGALTPGGLLVFLAYLKNAFRPVRNFAKYTSRLAKAAAAGERVLEILDQEPQVADHPDAITVPALIGPIRFDGIDFAYNKGAPILNGIDLSIEPGQIVAVVGPSGIGKSTLAGLISRLYDPTGGRVLIGETDIRDYTLGSLREQISTVLQDTLLFAGSIYDNIAYTNSAADEDQVRAAARIAGADRFITDMPMGYDTIIGERGVDLSNGQRQRIAIARAALCDAPILILDEPTSALDEENRTLIATALRRLAIGRTTLLITHDLTLAAMADRIVTLDSGRVAEQGTHAELMMAGGRYASLYRGQLAETVDAKREAVDALAG